MMFILYLKVNLWIIRCNCILQLNIPDELTWDIIPLPPELFTFGALLDALLTLADPKFVAAVKGS